MITIKEKNLFTDDEWMLLLKQNEFYNTLPPIFRFLRKPLCPLCHDKLSKTMVWQPVPGTDALPFLLNNYVWVCACSYKFADGDMTRGEFRIQSTWQYQCLDPVTGKSYDGVICNEIFDKINREGNAIAQKELAKLK